MLAEINTTPLVDVMLVLLIIFLITIRWWSMRSAVELPKRGNQPRQAQPDTIILSVDASGASYWFDVRLAERRGPAPAAGAHCQPEPAARVPHPVPTPAPTSRRGPAGLCCQRAGICTHRFLTEPPATLTIPTWRLTFRTTTAISTMPNPA